MKNALLLILLTAMLATPMFSQDEAIDWEETGGILYNFEADDVAQWWSFSCSADDGQLFYFDENPDKSGINSSDSCGVFETTPACVWEGCGSNSKFLPFDFEAFPIVRAKVYAPAVGLTFMLKAENYADNQASPIEVSATTATEFEWEELVFDFSAGAATGVDYERLIIFPDFGSTAESDIWYFDDIVIDGLYDDVETKVQQPAVALLATNYPNPFNPQTTIEYELPKASMVKLTVHDALGKNIQTLVSEKQNSGVYQVVFDGSHLASGVYYYRLQATDQVTTHKMLLIK